MTRHARATWMLLIATVIWGTSFPLTRALAVVQQGRAPLAGTWFLAAVSVLVRFAASGLLLLLCSRQNWTRPSRCEWRQGLGLAVCASGGLIFQIDGLYHTTASISAFLTQTYCVLIPLWLALRHRRWPGKAELLAVALVLAGVAMLSGIDWRKISLGRGEIETLLSSLFFAGQILWLERPAFRENRSGIVSVVMFLSIALLMAGLAAATLRAPADLAAALSGVPILWLLALLTVACTLYTFTTMNTWQPFVSATEAGLIYCLEPVFAALFATFLPGWLSLWLVISSANEKVGRELLLGGTLILVANVLAQIWPSRKWAA